jgi:DNA-binding NtrC family response regulator
LLITKKCDWCGKRDAFICGFKARKCKKADICLKCYQIVEPFRVMESVNNNTHNPTPSVMTLETAEAVTIERALRLCETKKSASSALGITRATLYSKMEKYGIEV